MRNGKTIMNKEIKNVVENELFEKIKWINKFSENDYKMIQKYSKSKPEIITFNSSSLWGIFICKKAKKQYLFKILI